MAFGERKGEKPMSGFFRGKPSPADHSPRPGGTFGGPGEREVIPGHTLETALFWAILFIAVFYRAALFFELSSAGFFDLVFVDNKTYLDVSLKLLEGELPGPLLKSALWFIQVLAIGLRLGVTLEGLHLLQYLSGVLTVLTIMVLGKRVFGPVPALVAGGILAVYGPLLFQESQLLAASWAAFFFSLSILLPLAFPGAPVSLMLLSGLFMGLGVQSQANMAIAALSFFFGLWIWKGRKKPVGPVLFLLGVFLAVLPVTLHNVRSGEFLPLSATGGINFFIGNGPQANGSFYLPDGYDLVNDADQFIPSSLIFPEKILGHPVRYAEGSRFWTLLTVKHMAEKPLRTLSMMGKKTVLLVQGWEIQNNLSYFFFRKELVGLPLPFDFGILFSFAFPVLVMAIWMKNSRPLLWALGGYAFSVVLFFVVDRYRLSLAPLIALFAGAGLVEIVARWRSGGFRKAGVFLVPVVLMLYLTHIPGWSSAGKEVSHGWEQVGRQHILAHRDEEAILSFQKAAEADRGNNSALLSLASLYANRQDWPKAGALYRQILDREPGNLKALICLGRVLKDSGDFDGALQVFLSGINSDSKNPLFFEEAAALALDLGQVSLASEIIEKATDRGMGTPGLLSLAQRVHPPNPGYRITP